MEKEFNIKGWKNIFYILGWIGVINLFFWAYQIIAYFIYNQGERFFTNNFHRRVYNWGIFMFIIFIILLITIVIAAWNSNFVRNLVEQQTDKTGIQMKCLNINFGISIDKTTRVQKIRITNNEGNTIPKFLVQKVASDGTSTTLTTIDTGLSGYTSTSVDISELVSGDKIRVIPYAQSSSGINYECSLDTVKELLI